MSSRVKRKTISDDYTDDNNVSLDARSNGDILNDTDLSQYRLGSIIRISMIDFVTYNKAVMYPGPKVNVIIGPNGSGKSTVVCAIVLGLGGSPEVLGRGKSPTDFIRTGADSATIEIELYGGENGNIIIYRKINKDGSIWKVNNRYSNKKEVITLIKKLHIQVDNLCQFLPQDKVSSFAAMNTIQLLKETERAVGQDELVELHEKLAELKKQKTKDDNDWKSIQKEVDDLKSQNLAVEKSIERFREKEKCLENIEYLKKKKAWVLFEHKREEAVELMKVRDDLDKRCKEYSDIHINPIKNKINSYVEKISRKDTKSREMMKRIKNLDSDRKEVIESILKLDYELDGLDEKYQSLVKSSKERDLLIRNKKKELEQHENTYNELVSKEHEYLMMEKECKETYNQYVDQLASLKSKSSQFSESIKEVQKYLQRENERYKKLYNVKEQRENSLPESHKVAYRWVCRNRDNFKGRVYGPILLETNILNDQFAVYLEIKIPDYIKYAYITETKEDRNSLINHFKKENINISVLHKEGAQELKNPVPLNELSSLGITHYMDQTFDSAPHVKYVLCSMHRLHMTAIGDDQANQHSEKLASLAQKGIREIYTPSFFHVTMISSFTKEASTNSRETRVNKEKMRFKSVNQQEIKDSEAKIEKLKQRENELREKMNEVNGLIHQKEREVEINWTKLEELKKRRRPEQIKSIIERKKLEIEELESKDIEKDKENLKKNIKAKSMEKYKRAIRVQKSLTEICNLTFIQCKDVITREQLRKLKSKEDVKLHNAHSDFEELRREYEHAIAEFKQAHHEAKLLNQEAKKIAPLTEELKNIFTRYPSDLDEIDEQIAENNFKANECFTNKEEVALYEERARKIQELEEKLISDEKKLETWQENIDNLKSRWLPQVENIISRINQNFGVFFKEIGCTGEVVLAKDSNDDFDKYGIEIWVTYRASEPLRKLDEKIQSGGERSVATMLYLIALQNLSHCPFRLVDEINQGMDPHNERMIFDQVAKQGMKENNPQYFMITPKLLPNLNFTKNITVLCIFNGIWQSPNMIFK